MRFVKTQIYVKSDVFLSVSALLMLMMSWAWEEETIYLSPEWESTGNLQSSGQWSNH